jgi:hypothetical protein
MRPRRGQERQERIAPEQGVHGHHVDPEAGHGPKGGGRLTQERLRVRRSGDVDVAALGIGDHQQAALTGQRHGLGEGGPAGRPEALEARHLGLDGHAVLGRRLDDQRTVPGHGAGGEHGRRDLRSGARLRRGRPERLRP